MTGKASCVSPKAIDVYCEIWGNQFMCTPPAVRALRILRESKDIHTHFFQDGECNVSRLVPVTHTDTLIRCILDPYWSFSRVFAPVATSNLVFKPVRKAGNGTISRCRHPRGHSVQRSARIHETYCTNCQHLSIYLSSLPNGDFSRISSFSNSTSP